MATNLIINEMITNENVLIKIEGEVDIYTCDLFKEKLRLT